ncbi:hypothetical protein BX661DRAFT_178853 [Kickxella alabastrina]|uniref:uncharacterized protein n=1 Tax=Kickxella alabastrina TaxID=61397 RepID=UPI00221F369B|nr:uncharacterized protein BX661DRAFT_178853 [Kickxella alabastrina]KAI7832951.1 hypothetical protein BX661DRAFT_178853 [Kickxella alabastrina]
MSAKALHILDLPLIVAELILRYTISEKIINRFKYSPLAVCREWRKLAICMTYQNAFYYSSCHCQNNCIHTYSNIDLINAGNYHQHVVNIHVSVSNHRGFRHLLDNYKTLFKVSSIKWDRVKGLLFHLQPLGSSHPGIEFSDANDELVPQASEMCDNLVRIMPNIQKLDLSTIKSNSLMTRVLNSKLVGAYYKQLSQFRSYYFVSFPLDTQFTNITSLYLCLTPTAERLLPSINAAALYKLQLMDVPLSFSWKYFQHDSTSTTITFTNLRKLTLNFTKISEDNDILTDLISNIDSASKPYTVHFPKLRALTLEHEPGILFIAASYVFPKTIEKVCIAHSFTTMDILSKAQIEFINDLNIVIGKVKKSFEDVFYQSTNHFFGKAIQTINSTLNLREIEFALDMQRLDWSSLSIFHWNGVFYFEQIPLLVSGLPGLLNLYINEVSFDDIPQNRFQLVDPEVHSKVQTAPLSVNLQWLVMSSFSGEESLTEDVIASMHCLILQLPSLNYLSLDNDSDWLEMNKFMSVFKEWYPHLEKMKIA